MAEPNRSRRWAAAAALCAALLAACASPEPAADTTAWGDAAEVYFETLAEAYTDNDFYGVLDFYAPGAEVDMWRADNRGGSSIPELLRWNSADLGHEVQGVYLADGEALTLVRWPQSGDDGAVVAKIEDGLITGETVYDLSASLGRSLRAAPDVLATYDELALRYASAWSSSEDTAVGELYGPAATLRDPLSSGAAADRAAILEIPRSARWTLLPASETTELPAADSPRAVYLGPAAYGTDPLRAIGIYSVVDAAGCERQIAVRWLLEADVVVEEQRYHEVESARRCSAAALPRGWWSALDLPVPSDQIVTGVVVTAEGQDIAIHNGTPLLEELLTWGLQRFSDAGLAAPQLDRVTFSPSRSCEARSGRVLDDGTTRTLYVCMYESEACDATEACSMPTTSARVAVLHELGHAWMLDNITDETEAELLDLSGRSAWNDLDVPWVERGAEYAAEVMAWGLMDADVPVVRLGSPPCPELARAFVLLTKADAISPAECRTG